MRAHNAEHRDSLPVLDVSSLRHVAYVLDALIYLMRGGGGANATNETQITGDRVGDREPYFWQISDAVCTENYYVKCFCYFSIDEKMFLLFHNK